MAPILAGSAAPAAAPRALAALLRSGYGASMCRSIKTLRRPGPVASEEEIHAAALQFVRKVSGYRTPSRANRAAFDAAVEEIAESSRRLLETIVVPAA